MPAAVASVHSSIPCASDSGARTGAGTLIQRSGSALNLSVQYEKLRHDLGGVEKVIRSLNHERRKQPENKRIAEVLGYFRNNRHRMGYAGVRLRAGKALSGSFPESAHRGRCRWA